LHRRPFLADYVAKVGEEQLASNNRIGTSNFFNQNCALVPDLESILLAQVLKFFLQHNRHKDIKRLAVNVRFRG
jgi:hypothetical protein